MANITEIRVGASYTLAATKNTPETAVKVVSVKGRWVRVAADFNGAEMNVAASALTEIVEPVSPKAEGDLPKNGKISPAARARYVRTKIDGATVIDCGDEVATMLRGMELPDVVDKAAGVLGVDAADLFKQYGHLNAGMFRMSVANRLRKALRNQSK